MEEYQTKYRELIELKKTGSMDSKLAAELIVEFAQYFSIYNLKMAEAQIAFDRLYSINIQGADSETGKAISAAKAEVLTKGSDESSRLTMAKSHVSNIEQMINALKSFTRSLANEYSYTSLT